MALAVVAVHDRERLAPVPLPGEQPVTQPVTTGRLPMTTPFQPMNRSVDRGGSVQASQRHAWHVHVLAGGVDDGPDRQAVRQRELQVPLIVGGHRHDGAGAVAHQHVVRYEYGNGVAGHRVDGIGAGKHARLAAASASALPVTEPRRRRPVRGDRRARVSFLQLPRGRRAGPARRPPPGCRPADARAPAPT